MLEKFLNKVLKTKSSRSLNKYLEEVLELSISYHTDGLINNHAVLLKNFLYNFINERIKHSQTNYINSSKVSTKRYIKKGLKDSSKIIKILEEYPRSNRDIGYIPTIFFKNIDANRENAILIRELLAKYSLVLNYDYRYKKNDNEFVALNTKDFEKELSSLLKQNISLKYIGAGANGNGFKLTIGSTAFFYKVFYPVGNFEIEDKHGCMAEVCFAYYANKYLPKDERVKFYFGRLTSKFQKDGFLITKFINKKEIVSNIRNNKLKIKFLYVNDNEFNRAGNSLEGKLVDFGLLEESHIKELKDASFRKMLRIILRAINYKHDSKMYKLEYKISNNSFKQLKEYVFRKKFKNYYESLRIMKKYLRQLPNSLLADLENIDSLPDNYTYKQVEILDTSQLLTTDLRKVIKNLRHYKIKIRTLLPPIFRAPGSLIAELNNDKIISFLFFKRKIHKIKIEKLNKEKSEYEIIYETTLLNIS